MGVYLGHDKVAGPGAFCNVSGSASKNLFDKATMVEFTNGYRLYTNGTFNSNSSFYGLKIPVQPNTTYTSSSNLTDTNLWSDLCFFDKGMNFISGVEGRANKTFTTPANCYFVTYAIYNQYQWFQLEKGSTATEYEEYYEPIVSVRDSNGVYHEVPYATGKVSKNLYPSGLTQVFSAPFIKLTKGTYTITEIDTTSGNWYFGAYKNGSVLSSGVSFSVAFNWSSTTEVWYRVDTTLKGFTFTLSEDCEVQIGRINANGTQKVQLEKSSTATEYEEYFEPAISIRTSNGTFQEVEFNKNNYSINEQLIGTWIDGKPLYRKIISASIPPNNDNYIDTGLNNATIVDYRAKGRPSWVSGVLYDGIWLLGQGRCFYPNNSHSRMMLQSTVSNSTDNWYFEIVLEYTKN